MVEKVIEALNLLKDTKRFYLINGHNKNDTYIYDSNAQTLYTAEKKLLSLWESNNQIEITKFIESLSLERLSMLLNLCNIILSKQEDIVADVDMTKANVMINTSNRCNLNCSYCYRDKNNSKKLSSDKIKNILEFATKKYKPDAGEFSLSYAMTSESSVDLSILKEIADEYLNVESYSFTENDIYEGKGKELFQLLKKDLAARNIDTQLPDESLGIVDYLNALLKYRNLTELLGLTNSMFDGGSLNDISKRYELAEWKYFRVNRWCLEKRYDAYLKIKRVPYVGFWFMSNGTNCSKEYIDFIKSVGINPFWISIDGPQEVHDFNRKFNNGNGSYKEVKNTVNVMLQNGITLKATSVLNAFYPRPLKIALHLLKMGFSEVTITPIRYGHPLSFTKENLRKLINGYDDLFKRLKNDALKNDFSLFHALRDDLSLSAMYTFLSRTKRVKRCEFDNQIVITPEGKIYPCLYFVGKDKFMLGNIKKGINLNKVPQEITVNNKEPCKNCWCRYLCGGTCFYNSYSSTGNLVEVESIECELKKYLCKQNLELIIFFREHNISFGNI